MSYSSSQFFCLSRRVGWVMGDSLSAILPVWGQLFGIQTLGFQDPFSLPLSVFLPFPILEPLQSLKLSWLRLLFFIFRSSGITLHLLGIFFEIVFLLFHLIPLLPFRWGLRKKKRYMLSQSTTTYFQLIFFQNYISSHFL